MAIRQDQLTTNNGAALIGETLHPVPAQSMTAQPFLLRQIPFGFIIQAASIYARTYTATLAVSIGFVKVGTALQAVTLEIAATTDRFKLGNAILGISGTASAVTGLPTIVQKAITDNLEFSSAYTINTAAASGQFWGAFRIQMSSDGTISTRAYAADQAFLSEADALRNCPAAAANMVNLGTITIQSATGAAFTCNTTALNAAGTTVNYNGAATGFVNAMTGSMAPVAATLVQGTPLTNPNTRTAQHPGALLVGLYTSDGSMAVADPQVNVRYRPYPLNNEAPFQE